MVPVDRRTRFGVVSGRSFVDTTMEALLGNGSVNLNEDTLDAMSIDGEEYTIHAQRGVEEYIVVESSDLLDPYGEQRGVNISSANNTLHIRAVNSMDEVEAPKVIVHGCATLYVTATAGNDDLIIERDDRRTVYHFIVTDQHTCQANGWDIVWRPVGEVPGIETKRCTVCDRIMDVRFTEPCQVHSFGEEETVQMTQSGSLFAVYRICSVCHALEFDVVDSLGEKILAVAFDANGGEGTMPVMRPGYGAEITLPENAFTHESLIFAGWSTSPDGLGEYHADGETFTLESSITLYAMWSANGKVDVHTENLLPDDETFVWDGEEHGLVFPDGLPTGITAAASGDWQAVEPGDYTAVIEFTVDESIYNPIEPMSIRWQILPAIVMEDADRIYDGTDRLDLPYTLNAPADVTLQYSLVNDDSGETLLDAAPVDAGTYRIRALAALENGAVAEAECSYVIRQRELRVSFTGGTRYYDGTSDPAGSLSVSNIAYGDSYAGQTFACTAWRPGTYHQGAQLERIAIIRAATGRDVSDNYCWTCDPVDITILPAPLTVTAADAEYTYDGMPKGGTVYEKDGLIDGDTLTAEIDGSATEPGTYPGKLTPTEITIVNAAGEDVTDCYSIDCVPGTLTIHPVYVGAILPGARQIYALPGDAFRMVATVLPANATYPELEVTSSDPAVLTVEDSLVTAKAAGTADLVLSATDGSGVRLSVPVVVGGLRSYKLPAAMTLIEEDAFTGLPLPETLDLSDYSSLTIQGGAFNGCVNLKRVILPAQIRLLGGIVDDCPDVVLFCRNTEQAGYAQRYGYAYIMLP